MGSGKVLNYFPNKVETSRNPLNIDQTNMSKGKRYPKREVLLGRMLANMQELIGIEVVTGVGKNIWQKKPLSVES